MYAGLQGSGAHPSACCHDHLQLSEPCFPVSVLRANVGNDARALQRCCFCNAAFVLPYCCRGRPADISQELSGLGVVTEKGDPSLRTEMAYGMFDTRGKARRAVCSGVQGCC